MADNTLNINAKSVAKYVLLPGIIPRAKALATGRFGYLAFLFACIYRAVRILPANHPYTNPDNIGTFGLIKVIAEAANHLEFNKRNLDKIAVFIVLFIGLIMLALQFVLVILGLFAGRAHAGPGPFTNIFVTENPQTDVAFMLLDYVFGIPGPGGGAFFESNALAGGPTPFHEGLHALFNFYNLAILLVAVLVFLYYVMVVVVETAQTGVPFGRRFSKLYAPFRLIIAVGLLVPLNYGFNGAQYVTLYAAKLGSSFATNGWILFNRNLVDRNPTGAPTESLVAKPRAPSIESIMHYSSVYHACREMYSIFATDDYLQNDRRGVCIRPYVIVNGQAQIFANSPSEACNGADTPGGAGFYFYGTAKREFGATDMEIVLGEYNPALHTSYAGNVRPYCGIMTVSLNNDNPAVWSNGGAAAMGGVRSVEATYYQLVRAMLSGTSNPRSYAAFGERAAHSWVPVSTNPPHNTCHEEAELGDGATCEGRWSPTASAFAEQTAFWRTHIDTQISDAYNSYRYGLELMLTTELEQRGWGGAGIWYNHIADINGSFTSAVYATPQIKQYPEVMEFVKKKRMAQNKSSTLCGMFDPNLGDNKKVEFLATKDFPIATALNKAYEYFSCEKPSQEVGVPNIGGTVDAAGGCQAFSQPAPLTTGSTIRGTTSNILVDVISVVFGINGLFDIRNASCVDPATGRAYVHPLAQLSTIGRSLIENAIRNVMGAMMASFGGGLVGILGPGLGPALNAMSGIAVSVATLGLTAGFVLYYVLPFLPFIYFFFAVGSWVKSLFEAMVGVPLWALAHLSIDGDGLPGRAARGGYYLIFEIFLRPIVIVFGLIGGMAVFAAMATALNNVFDLVVMNITGALPTDSTGASIATETEVFRRGIIDQFFFTIMYAVLLYMMATASFKMIDNIPSMIMRWMSPGVSTFNDNKSDPTSNLTTYASIATNQFASPILGKLTQGSGAIGSLTGQLARRASSTE